MQIKIPEKPEALEKFEQCEALGLPLVAGGLQDQPHIWLMEIGVILNVRNVFSLANERNTDA